MTGLPDVVLPLGLGGALFAGISMTGRGRTERSARGGRARGALGPTT